MNIKGTLKTIAIALPLSIAPMKTTAQTVAKNTQKAATEFVQKRATQAVEPLYVKANLGAGYGLEPFMNKGVAEAKAYATVGVTNNKVTASAETAIGKTTQAYGARIGGNITSSNPDLNIETGVLFRQVNNKNSVILEKDLKSISPECAEKYNGTSFWGMYLKPNYQIGKANINATLETGFAGLTSGIRGNSKNITATPNNIVNRKKMDFVSNMAIGADYNIAKGLKVGGDYNYSTYNKKHGFNLKAIYEFTTRNLRGKKK